MHPKYSVVAPVFNESEGIGDFIQEVARVLHKLGESWELVLVNDGSSDESREKNLRGTVPIPGNYAGGFITQFWSSGGGNSGN